MEIVCFGIREFEIPFFNDISTKRNYKFILHTTFLTDDIVTLSKGYEIIMIRGNCFLGTDAMQQLHNNGIKIILSRSVGYNHLDIQTCKKNNLEVLRVPSYSPNAIAELAVTKAMMLLRNVCYTVNRTSKLDFTIDSQMFSREIRNCTVGIIGCGQIGYTAAKLFSGLGANVIVYNRSKKLDVNYVSLDELLEKSDVISIHMPYFKDENHHFINKEVINKMKHDAILVNTSRGDLINTDDLLCALEGKRLYGAALDVIENENDLFFKKHDKVESELHQRIINLYPKLIITPHVGASTDEALRNMIDYSLDNLEEFYSTKSCKNSLIK